MRGRDDIARSCARMHIPVFSALMPTLLHAADGDLPRSAALPTTRASAAAEQRKTPRRIAASVGSSEAQDAASLSGRRLALGVGGGFSAEVACCYHGKCLSEMDFWPTPASFWRYCFLAMALICFTISMLGGRAARSGQPSMRRNLRRWSPKCRRSLRHRCTSTTPSPPHAHASPPMPACRHQNAEASADMYFLPAR